MKLSEQIARWKELTPEEKLAGKTELVGIAREQMKTEADRALTKDPHVPQGIIPLGVYMETASFPRWVGVHHLGGRWVGIETAKKQEHTLVVGKTGKGKSVSAAFWVQMLARHTDADIFVIDAKGEKDPIFSQLIATIISKERGIKVPISYVGYEEVGAVYDSFQGSADAIYNRLAELIDVAELEGNATHYREMYRVFLRLVCNAPQGPPRSLAELNERMSFDWLEKAWQGHPAHLKSISRLKDHAKDVGALFNRVSSLWMTFDRYMGPEGFSLDTSQSAVFAIKTLSVGDDAPRYVKFFLSDVGDWISSRRQRPAVLVIDEFGALDNYTIVQLLKQGRSMGLGIILTTQSLKSLGETTQHREEFLDLCSNVFLMHISNPDEFLHLAGTEEELVVSRRVEQGEVTSDASLNPQSVYRLKLNDVHALQEGQGYYLRDGQKWKIKTRYLGDTPINPDAIAVFPKRMDEGPDKDPIPRMPEE